MAKQRLIQLSKIRGKDDFDRVQRIIRAIGRHLPLLLGISSAKVLKRSSIRLQTEGGKYMIKSQVYRNTAKPGDNSLGSVVSRAGGATTIIGRDGVAYRPAGFKAHPTKITTLSGRLIRSLQFGSGAFQIDGSGGTREGIIDIKVRRNTFTAKFGTKVPYAQDLEDGGRPFISEEFKRIKRAMPIQMNRELRTWFRS